MPPRAYARGKRMRPSAGERGRGRPRGCHVTIDALHRYPVDLIDVVRLAGGARVVLRPALPQDAELQRAFFRALSEQARYQRFMSKLSDVGQDMAARFSAIDYRSHVALVAEIFTDGGEIMIGEARYVVDDRD